MKMPEQWVDLSRVNDKDTRMTSLSSIWGLCCSLWINFTCCSDVYIVSLPNSRRCAAIADANTEVYWEKALSRRQNDVGVVWHPDSLFQPNDISVGTSFLQKIPYSFPRPYTGNQCPLAIMYNLLIFLLLADLNSLDTTFVEHSCYLF